MTITIVLNTDNAAFENNPMEITRILSEFAYRFSRNADLIAPLFDSSGNRVGSVTIEETR